MSYLDTVRQIAEGVAVDMDNHINKNIANSHFDRTYTGRVVDKQTYRDTINNLTIVKRWLISANGASYYVNAENSNITSVGQSVRLYVPNNNKEQMYAEVVNPATAPDKITYTEDDKDYSDYKEYGVNSEKEITKDDITVDTIVEEWNLTDMTKLERVYILTVINADSDNEEVTNIVCPDGKQINLEGFIIG